MGVSVYLWAGSVKASGFRWKAVVLVVSKAVFFMKEKQNADHLDSLLFCPTVFWTLLGPKCHREYKPAQHSQPKFTSIFCTLDPNTALSKSLNS